MTVSTTDSVVEYVSGGPAFPIPYRFLQNSDIQAVLVKQDGTSETLTGAQYTLSGAGVQNGGALTSAYAAGFLAAPGASLTISRVMSPVQPTDLRNQGKFLAETHETVFDRLTMLIQQGFSGLSRALKRPVGKSYFDAEGRLISNVADPVSDQDAATKGWAGRYFGDLIDGATGLINTTTGILYDSGTLFDYLRFGVGRNVDSVAALRLLSSARNQRAFAIGYYQKGDGGGGPYYVDPTDTTSLDNGGTIIVAADGARWKLNRNGMVSVRQFGAKGDGSFDDAPFIEAAHATQLGIFYPDGVYRCSRKVTLTGIVVAHGTGTGSSKLLFNGATQGMDVTQTTSGQNFDICKLTFLTSGDATVFTGLRINGIPQITSTTDGLRFVLGDRQKYRGVVRDLVFAGATDGTGWKVGLHIQSLMNYMIENITYTGQVPEVAGRPTGDFRGVAILLNGDGIGTDVRLRGIWVFYAQYGLLAPDYMEGIHLTDVEMVAVTYGVMGRYTPGYSVLPQAACGCLAMYVDQIHINCLQGGIIMSASNGNFMSRMNIYTSPRAGDSISYGVYITGGNDHRIRDLYVSGDGAGNTKTANYGLLLQGVGLSFVDSVTVSSLLSAVHLAGSSYNEIMNIQSRASLSVVSGDSGSLQNSVGPGRASSNTGAKYSLPLDNTLRMDEYAAFASRTLTAGATATISLSLPAGTFTEAPRFATLSIDQSTIYYKVQYLRSSSSASQVQFLLAPASPASTIPAETIEVSVNAKGI